MTSQRWSVFARDSFQCRYCGRRPPEVELELEHTHAKANGGDDSNDNLVTACKDCNRSKGKRSISSFLVPPRDGESRALVGKYFHSFVDCTVCGKPRVAWQGYVVGSPRPDIYVVQLFEWLLGEPNVQRLVPFDKMVDWDFYQDGAEMKHAYRHCPGWGNRHRDCDTTELKARNI